SPGLKRVFSSTVTRSSPTSSRRRSRTGAIEYLARSSSVFGRPRCEQTRTWDAPPSSSSRIVGSDARMRVSSATRPCSSGTLRSARTRTTLPSTFASRTDLGNRKMLALDRCRELVHEVDQPARVAPLVVVPAEHLHQVPPRHGQLAVEDARVRRLLDVGRDEWVGRVLQVGNKRTPRAAPPLARR